MLMVYRGETQVATATAKTITILGLMVVTLGAFLTTRDGEVCKVVGCIAITLGNLIAFATSCLGGGCCGKV